MPDVQVNQTNIPPSPPPPPPDRSGAGIWPIVVGVLVVVIALVWFIFARGERTEVDLPEASDIEVSVPTVETPELEAPDVNIEMPEKVEVEVPDVDVNVKTEEPQPSTAQKPPESP